MTEVWGGVIVFGPQSEIDRFHDLCLVPDPRKVADDDEYVARNDWIFCGPPDPDPVKQVHEHLYRYTETWNFYLRDDTLGKFSFSFDTSQLFPKKWFELLAEMFPKLKFYCNCIADDDNFMGEGWFNPPLGGEPFRQDLQVPGNYWTTGSCYRRKPADQALHEALLAKMQQAAYEESMAEEEDELPF